MRKVILLCLMLCLSQALFAQAHLVKGTIKDSEGNPVIGASIVEEGTSNGTTTDPDGYFELRVNHGAYIIITLIGYQSGRYGPINHDIDITPFIIYDDSNLRSSADKQKKRVKKTKIRE